MSQSQSDDFSSVDPSLSSSSHHDSFSTDPSPSSRLDGGDDALLVYNTNQTGDSHGSTLMALLLEDYVHTRMVAIPPSSMDSAYEYVINQLCMFNLVSPAVRAAATREWKGHRRQLSSMLDRLIRQGEQRNNNGRPTARLSETRCGPQMERRLIDHPHFDITQAGLQRSASFDILPAALRSPSLFTTDNVLGPTPSRSPLLDCRYRTDFREIRTLGKGAFGKVYHVRSLLDKADYACKMIHLKPSLFLPTLGSRERLDAVLQEIETLAKMHHKNIVRYYGSWIEDDNIFLPPRPVQMTGSTLTEINEEAEPDIRRNISRNGHASMEILFAVSEDPGKVSTVGDSTAEDMILGDERSGDGIPSSSGPHSRSLHNLVAAPDPASASLESGLSNVTSSNVSLDDRPSSRALVPTRNPTTLPRKASGLTLHILTALYNHTLKSFLDSESKAARHCFCLIASLRLFLDIIAGVKYLHEKHIVHRDLKPANVFLSLDGPMHCCRTAAHAVVPTIGDFGLVAKIKSTQEGLTSGNQAEHVVGTVFYRAPERGTEAAFDIWALGVLLVELLVPFTTSSGRIFTLTELTEYGVVPQEVIDKGGEELAEVVRGCIQRDPAQRWTLPALQRAAEVILKKAERKDDDDAVVYGSGTPCADF